MVVPLKDKNITTNTDAFQKNLSESGRKSNKTWVDKSRTFYNKSLKSWLEKMDVKIYSTYNDGKLVVAERFIKTLKSKTYKYMASL